MKLWGEQYSVLSSRQIWTKQFAIFGIANYAIAFTIIDVIPRESSERWWAAIAEIICLSIMLMLGMIVRKIMLTYPETRTQNFWLNIGLATLILIITNAIGSPLLHLPHAFDLQLFVKDTTIGFFGGLYIGLMYVTLLGTLQLQRQSVARLQATQATLKDSIAISEQELQGHQQALLAKANKAIKPEVVKLKKQLEKSASSQAAIAKLQQLVYKDVSKLVTEAKTFDVKAAIELETIAATPQLKQPLEIKLDLDLNPIRIWLTLLPGTLLYLLVAYPKANIFAGPMIGLSLLITLIAIKFFESKRPRVKTAPAILILVATSVAFALGMQLGWSQLSGVKAGGELFWMSLYGSLVVILTNTIVSAYQRANHQVIADLSDANNKLQVAVEVLNRNIWVTTAKWYSVLHSRVQSTLTKSLLRLTSQKHVTRAAQLAVISDLEDVSTAIAGAPSQTFNFDTAIKEVVKTWRPVCNVTFNFTTQARSLIKRDANLGFVLNELLKESVSNLFAQLGSKSISFNIDIFDEGHISVNIKSPNPNGLEIDPGSFGRLNYLATGWHSTVAGEGLEMFAKLSTQG